MKRLRVQWLDDDMIQDCPWSASYFPIRRDGLDTLNDKEFVSDEVVAFGCRWISNGNTQIQWCNFDSEVYDFLANGGVRKAAKAILNRAYADLANQRFLTFVINTDSFLSPHCSDRCIALL